MFRSRSLLIAEIPHLRRYARALLHDRDAADDLVQASLERALGRWQLWRPNRRLRPWLFAIMHNLYVDMVRHRAQGGVCVSLSDMYVPPSLAARQDEQLNAQAVLTEIDNLEQDHKDVLILVGIDALSYAEAAEVLSIPVGTLMSRLHRARTQLRRNLGMAERKPPIRRVK